MNPVAKYFSSLKDYSLSFWILCLHMLLFFASFNLLIPEMNSYITSLGGAEYKWMVLGLWTVAAAVSRPVSGKIADNISRKSVMYFGVLISVVISFMYPFFLNVAGFLFLRFLHGFSTGFHPTGASALVADVIPKGKRGEAMGIFGITITLGFTSGQAMGSVVKMNFGIEGLFMTCGILGLISILLIGFIKENKHTVQQNALEKGYHTRWDKMIPKWDEVIGPEVMQPAVIMFLQANIAGVYFLLVPDMSEHLGFENKGLFFLVNVGVVVVTRFISGKLVDRIGARKNLYVSMSVLAIGCFVTGSADTGTEFLLSSLIYGFGAAIGSPAIMAWTADLSNPKYKGRGMGTMFIMLELGFLSGNYFAQLIYDNQPENFYNTFLFGMTLGIIGVGFLIFTRKMPLQVFN
ncbi:MAG: MFS transporter [Crocinitomicaceae bacterium]|nr:MFS transporter [Crocinitomicaceae bacterium]